MDVDNIKNFFIFHIEKMILGVVVVVAGLLVYSGLNKEPITSKYDPDRLKTDAIEVKRSVDDVRTEAIVEERIPTFNIDQEIERKTKPIAGAGYKVDLWEPIPADLFDGVKRRDPELLAALDVRAVGVSAPMAVLSTNESYALMSLESAGALAMEEKEKPKPSGRRRGGRRNRDEMEMEMEEMEMEGMEGMEEMEAEMEMAGPVRRMNSSDAEGFRPLPQVKDEKGIVRYSVPYKGSFIAGTAVVPYKELHENYERAFRDAEGFNPLRDRPVFLGYELQRADVTGKTVNDLGEDDWVKRYGSETMPILAAKFWAGYNAELIAQEYRVDNTLTMWIPPVMMADYSTFCLHPKIPMKTAAQLLQEQLLREREQEMKQQMEALDDFNKFKVKKGGAGNGFGEMFDDSMGMDDQGMNDNFNPASRTEMLDQNPVDYKLIRFYDFSNPPSALGDKNPPKENRQYVYRVRYFLNDPNFPELPTMQPAMKSLDGDSYARVDSLVAEVVKTRVRKFQLSTPWSKPCDPVSLVSSSKAYAGPVKGGSSKSVALKNRTITYQVDPPKAEMVIQAFEDTYNTNLMMRMPDVTEGSVLATRAEVADIVDPITLEVKALPNAEIMTSTTVIDISGGDELTIQTDGDAKLASPGLVLMFDENGGLRLHEEAGDQKRFRAKSFATERGQ